MRRPLLSITAIASICHMANRALAASIGEDRPSWQDTTDEERASAVAGVENIINGSVTRPEQSHEAWFAFKQAGGWVYGPTKDTEAKTHPCMVPFDELPPEQQAKDALFFAIVTGLSVEEVQS